MLVREAKLFDKEMFFKMFRMSPTKFEELLHLVALDLTKPNARGEPIRPEEWLAVTLRYLVTGNAFSTIGSSYRMSDASVGRIVKETCYVLWNKLVNDYVICPKIMIEWENVANNFERYWNFPNCVGAIDGKHVISSISTSRRVHVLQL